MFLWSHPSTGILVQGGHKFTILVDHSLVIIAIHIQFVWSMSRHREEDF